MLKSASSTKHPHKSQPHQYGFVMSLLALLMMAAVAAMVFYVVHLNATVVSKFEARKWDIPATLYSRPLTLYQGAALPTGGPRWPTTGATGMAASPTGC